MLEITETRRRSRRLASGLARRAGGALGILFALSAYGPAAFAEGPASTLAGLNPFTLTIDKVTAKRGQPAAAKVLFRAAGGYHVNVDYPTELRLKLPDNVTAQKATLTKQDAKLTDAEGRFDVVLTGSQLGKKTVLGELRFAVCTATTCDPKKVPVAIELNVE